jgi:hypothetical protein
MAHTQPRGTIMHTDLTALELAVVRRYLSGTTSGGELPLGWTRAASGAVAAVGLVLAAYATLLFLQHPTYRVAALVLLPGSAAGLLLVVVGFGIQGYSARARERARLAAILRKLLPGEQPGLT